MNKLKTLFVVGSIVTLLGTGCGRKQSTPIEKNQYKPNETTQYKPNIEKIEYMDGYILRQQKPYREFEHNNIKNYDELQFDVGDQRIIFIDRGCDGIVDTISALAIYARGEPRTKGIFEKADKDLQTAKKELGVK